ncbi:DUF6473 family protein [Shimia marina]|uniref:DUF6473 domain-containing protein n=1 Tax=Shimia marina TaxID=321267 RepID=A0A0P1EKA6_9RHOB|nr:DUF6473 family protein [Shimia marina]CUH50960.1 hypothetical protein SHM7688_00392 [Shimia marina]SFD61627.1 hypothetical protein SAMN04488037_101710 [Shimia marina]
MSYEKMVGEELNYEPCQYGESRLTFRGPQKSLEAPYIAFLGGTETYGKFVPQPFVEILDEAMEQTCVNLGYLNAGIDAFLSEPAILEIAQQSEVTVVQIMGAQNMSNRYYKVHPRRNDRFIGASNMMQMVFNEVDFSEFHFTRHMLGTLCARTPDRYAMVRDELRMAWSARMKLLLNTIGGKIVLLWVADHAPDTALGTSGLGPDPLFVDRLMIEELRPLVADVVEVVASQTALSQGVEGMQFTDLERVAAQRMLGVQAHVEAAQALSKSLEAVLSGT